ncbi:FAD dependent oxidoreductase [Apiospora kogelbergensis]|uniref:FAD dependent oxidoreductase n=1 Tax=Apiospora kogelbergensis TaxID=1337665 RepID=A0AAW0QM39_9PEZI
MAAKPHENHLLPVASPTLSYWRSEPHRLDSHRSTEQLPATCDIAIIGAGFSGVSVAYHLSTSDVETTEGPPSIVLLEARQVCSGATGRNGGHVKLKTASITSIIQEHGLEAADDFAALVRAQIDALKELVETEQLDCEFELRRSYDVFLHADEAQAMEAKWSECLRKGYKWTREHDFVGEKFAERVTSVRGAKAAFSGPACSLWPYKLVTQLLEKAMERNPHLNLQTETPVLSVEALEEGRSGTIIHTERGSIRAKKAVFATNAYTAGLLPQYRGVINPYRGTASHLTLPKGADPVFPHLSHTYNIEYGLKYPASPTVDYLNPRPDGGIVVGGGRWLFQQPEELWQDNIDDSALIGPVLEAAYFEGYMQRVFRGWENSGTKLDKVWTGIMASTKDGMPHIGKVPQRENQWVIAAFNGAGMTQILLLGKAIADMVKDDKPFEATDTIVPRRFQTTLKRMET